MMKLSVKTIASALLAFMMVVFGLNKFIGFIPMDPPVGETAQQFMGLMFTTYLFGVVALFEILGGALLLHTKTRLLGWLLLAPVIFNIAVFHFAHDFIGNGIWLLPMILFGVIGFTLIDRLILILKTVPNE